MEIATGALRRLFCLQSSNFQKATTSMHAPTRLCAASLLLLACASSHSAEWSDAFIGLGYGSKFKEPGSDAEVTKTIVTLQYVGGYKYGVNFFNVDMLQSDENNTAANSPRGAQEVYVVYSNTVSLGKASGAPMKFGPVRDVGVQAGIDFNSKNDSFGAGLVKFIAGPKVEFDVPGLWTLGLFYYKENNNNSIAGKDVDFDAAVRVSTVWSFEIAAGLPLQFKGWANWTGEKGKDGFGGDTAAETWLETSLLADLGALAGKPKTVYAGIGYQYIRNKFGNQPSLPGTKVSAPALQVQVHF